MNSGPPAGTNAPRAGTSSSTQSARSASATSASVAILVTTPDFRAATTWRLRIDGRRRAGVWILAVDELTRVVTDEFDQRRYAKRLADVVHVDHQGRDTRQHEEIRRRHGDAWNLPCAIAAVHNLADRQHSVHEGRDEEPDGELAGLVAKDPLHDPGRELPIASWTTTIVIVSTSVARLTIETAIVVKTAFAEVGRPTSTCESAR